MRDDDGKSKVSLSPVGSRILFMQFIVPRFCCFAGLWFCQLRGAGAGGVCSPGSEWCVVDIQPRSAPLQPQRCLNTDLHCAGKDVGGKELFVGRAQKKAEREAMLRAK